jgi:hypothetical protein
MVGLALLPAARAGESAQTRWLNNFFATNGASAGAPKDPLWKGLPDEITRDYPEREGFVEFQHVEGDVPPVGGGLKISDPDLTLMDVFEDQSYARLPDGAAVSRETRGGQEFWDYPVGTRVMHRISFKTDPRKLFELRLVQKLPSGQWAFGVYMAEEGASTLRLHREGMPALSYDIVLNGKPVRVDLHRISPSSCRMCHFHMGHGGYQYPDADHAGPCGFSPPNPHLATDWARDYEARYGYAPFADKPKLARRP